MSRSVSLYFENDEWKALSCFLRRTPIPQREVVRWVGKLGGHLGRKVDGEPGAQAMWEGLGRTHDLTATARLSSNFSQGS